MIPESILTTNLTTYKKTVFWLLKDLGGLLQMFLFWCLGPMFEAPRNWGKILRVTLSPIIMVQWKMANYLKGTLPETNSSPLRISHPNRKVVFQPSIFRGYVSFREGNYYWRYTHFSLNHVYRRKCFFSPFIFTCIPSKDPIIWGWAWRCLAKKLVGGWIFWGVEGTMKKSRFVGILSHSTFLPSMKITNMHLKMDGWNMSFISCWGLAYFQRRLMAVSFREGF